jgi:threonine aldolase
MSSMCEYAELKILFPTQANAVFADLPPYVIHALWQSGWKFYTFIGADGCQLTDELPG